MEATLFLADSAQTSPDGKLHALGIGWTYTSSPMTAPSAVAFILHVPWAETNRKIEWALDLLDADGAPVVLQTGPEDYSGLHMESEIEVGRPSGTKPGSDINVPFAVNIAPMPLPPDGTFVWVLTVGDRKWRAPFTTRPLPRMPQQ
ncbi:MAG: hypothetical protein WA431_05060 [Candidatus Cybelea sp.]